MANPFDAPGDVNSEDRKIWWLASYPKSGNTWVRMFLNCYATQFPVNINTVFQYVVIDLRPEVFQMMSPRSLTEMSIREQFMYYPGAMVNLIKLANTKDVTVKTHNAKASVGGIAIIPADLSAGAVYLIRDPRDIVISVSHHFGKNINESIQMLNEKNRAGMTKHGLYHMFMSWEDNVISWTNNNKDVPTLVIKYEDLLTQPEPAFNAILDHLQIKTDDHEARFKFAMEQTTFENLQKNEDKNGFIEKVKGDKFFRVGKSGQWKDILTKYQVKMITDYNGEIMERYGYV